MDRQRQIDRLAIKAAVRERDGWRCVECGVPDDVHRRLTGRSLDVHRNAPGSRYTVEGCITLCRDCHVPKPRSKPGAAGTGCSVVVDRDTARKLRALAYLAGCKPDQLIAEMVEGEFARFGVRERRKKKE